MNGRGGNPIEVENPPPISSPSPGLFLKVIIYGGISLAAKPRRDTYVYGTMKV
jgi:hypothetical protein